MINWDCFSKDFVDTITVSLTLSLIGGIIIGAVLIIINLIKYIKED